MVSDAVHGNAHGSYPLRHLYRFAEVDGAGSAVSCEGHNQTLAMNRRGARAPSNLDLSASLATSVILAIEDGRTTTAYFLGRRGRAEFGSPESEKITRRRSAVHGLIRFRGVAPTTVLR